MRNYIIQILFYLPFFLSGQTDFTKADTLALTQPDDANQSIQHLAKQLTETLETDIEKARSIYMWVANNVRYDCRKFHNPQRPRFSAATKEEVAREIREWRAKQLNKTLTRKKGICEDYSRLFKALCDEAGVECELISGDARDFHKPHRRAHDNPHAWNAIKIDGKWHLVDATWGAGYVNPEVTRFSRRLSDGYFMTDPVRFAQTHFPKEEKWQLLPKPLSTKEFAAQPMINVAQQKFKIAEFSPAAKASTKKKNAKEIRLKFENAPDIFSVTSRRGKPVKFERKKEGNEVVFYISGKASSVVIFGNKNGRRKLEWLARYDL